jgi:hypothetical protein
MRRGGALKMRILQAAVIVHFHGLEIATVFYINRMRGRRVDG